MASEFAASVDYGLRLSKRIYYGKGTTAPPAPEMSRSPEAYLPTAPMVYAVVPDPTAVDNPDVPSYQPYVHGRCDPPALIPLHMHSISAEVDCYLDTAFVSIAGVWRVHCIMARRRCDCRVAIPMGEQGLLLGVEVNLAGRSYNSELINAEDMKETLEITKAKDGQFLKFQTFTFRVPQVDGGSTISVKASWSQKLSYSNSEFLLTVPFSFPGYVNPIVKNISRKQLIRLNVDTGTGMEVLCRTTSHPMKELRREVGKLAFSSEVEVSTWSSVDLKISYSVSSSDIFGDILLQSPPLHDFDQSELLCFYLYPGNNQSRKVFRKEVVYVMDISGSMQDDLLVNTKDALMESLWMLNPEDSFNIIAFNHEARLFSLSMEKATKKVLCNAHEWISNTFVGDGGTDILPPLEQAMKLLADTTDAVPLVFLVTDGTVENEREICNTVKRYLSSGPSVPPRFFTFGIGPYCNHYFLQALARIGRGHYDAAYDAESVAVRMKSFFAACSSVVVADIGLDVFETLDSLELFPSQIPDLLPGRPLIVSGRYSGDFPESVKVSGTLADGSVFTEHLKVKWAKDVALDRVLARRQIDVLTAEAWLQESQQLGEKVARMSVRYGVPSEYTCMILLETVSGKVAAEQKVFIKEVYEKMSSKKPVEWKGQQAMVFGSLGKGFGNLKATTKNIKPGTEESKPSDAASILVNAASSCCARLMDRFCCMCFIRTCSFLNDQCTQAFTQLCTALACFECINCCFEVCECCSCLQ
ncbi:uncharacterized protein LOC116210185 isoform X1 [Punica granatum]|uniref:Uncharacterized protein LOC116210185 isoform X1 n=1 Tax=Punica granatum TaxID=22663 RepID=A0A6P8DVV4_PUNGR|nr:uncharacterized protein LOC116210185 isoform X1 [Punica granatum]